MRWTRRLAALAAPVTVLVVVGPVANAAGSAATVRGHAAGAVAATLPSTLSVSTSTPVVTYPGTATVTVSLGAPATSNREVSLYALPQGGWKRLVGKGVVDANGTLTLKTTVYQNTTFAATYAGDDATDPATAKRVVTVRPVLTTSVTAVIGTRNGDRLVRARTRSSAIGTLKPGLTNQCAKFEGQLATSATTWGSSWISPCYTIGGDGIVSVGLVDFDAGDRIRVRYIFPGDARYVAVTTAWTYVTFVK